ncbi:MAG: hypothetical protein KAS78_05990 [Candidatus Pacebacteria bacterium]|nr:hypothetical protein [Candidatus Paceibacterota bacterium]
MKKGQSVLIEATIIGTGDANNSFFEVKIIGASVIEKKGSTGVELQIDASQQPNMIVKAKQ